jgi:hypothetical protein
MRAHAPYVPHCAELARLAEEGAPPEEEEDEQAAPVQDDPDDPYEFPADEEKEGQGQQAGEQAQAAAAGGQQAAEAEQAAAERGAQAEPA